MLSKWENKAWIIAHLFTTLFTEYFKPIVEIHCSEKNIPFNKLLFSDNASGHPRDLMGLYSENNVLMPGNTTCILQHMDQGVNSMFKYYLRNTFCKVISAMGSVSLMDLGKVNWKPSGKDLPF